MVPLGKLVLRGYLDGMEGYRVGSKGYGVSTDLVQRGYIGGTEWVPSWYQVGTMVKVGTEGILWGY